MPRVPAGQMGDRGGGSQRLHSSSALLLPSDTAQCQIQCRLSRRDNPGKGGKPRGLDVKPRLVMLLRHRDTQCCRRGTSLRRRTSHGAATLYNITPNVLQHRWLFCDNPSVSRVPEARFPLRCRAECTVGTCGTAPCDYRWLRVHSQDRALSPVAFRLHSSWIEGAKKYCPHRENSRRGFPSSLFGRWWCLPEWISKEKCFGYMKTWKWWTNTPEMSDLRALTTNFLKPR